MGTIREDSAAEIAEQLEAQQGRRAPFSMVGDWVLLAPIRPQAKVLYWALMAHVNHDRDNTEVWPSQNTLATIMGMSDGRKIRPYLNELVAINAVEIRKARSKGGMRQRSIYVVHQAPPDGFEGPEKLSEFYKARKAKIEVAQTEQLELEMPVEPKAPKKAA